MENLEHPHLIRSGQAIRVSIPQVRPDALSHHITLACSKRCPGTSRPCMARDIVGAREAP
ncbi:hypothetical protein MYCTH_2307403 [Thermothelomyces thermophilus ATCC 42464]|uniref:Uncharacterized protein n=1 Tax=Thermothelomyces thermophilus (strain ATCC 42464 / BCRC 31852 / DSM 1799) TaxID=573729 RepID=G2QFP2_THET4|nr:uncharacterized protein MYCTH_2307403 [Thermothelomyces thermophilus ATCC 42464]AEO59259.1 hypothetical protein MYCTH_2307403 [Thermothelomyces thermophilus ATCC 42464]